MADIPDGGKARYSDEDLLPLSALQHLLFCERQCALIHVEQVWTENRLTVEGRHLHERVDERSAEQRGAVRSVFGVPLRCLRLGLVGKADLVEYRRDPGGSEADAVPCPVEYKRGRPKKGAWDEVQVCAQALCLEEMLSRPVPAGVLFYGAIRRRQEVAFTPELRRLTEQTAERLHRLVAERRTPPAVKGPRCKNCSLQGLCLPKVADGSRSVQRYLARELGRIREEGRV